MHTTPDAPTAPRRAGRREWIGLAVLSLACLLYVMDLTVLHLAVPRLSEDLRPSSTQLLWIIDVYGFMVAGALVTMGTLGDRIGRRRLLLVGAAAFGAVSVLAAFSTTPEMLIVSRALLGLAGATVAPSTLSLIFAMFPDPRQRSRAVGIWIGAFSAGSAVGPVLGGLVLERFWWGAVFLLTLPVMGALLVLGPKVLPEYRDPGAGRLDLLSVGMSVTALLAVVYGVKQLVQDGVTVTSSAAVVGGVVVGVLWTRRQRRLADPMIDVRLFGIRTFRSALVVNFTAIFVMVGYFLFVGQYLQLVVGLSPLVAGLWSLPSAVAFVIASQAGPRVVARFRPATVVAVGLAGAAVGLGLLTLVAVDHGLTVLVVASVVVAVGMGPVFGLTTELVVGSAPAEKAGAASGVSETAAELGGALGIAALGSVGAALYRAGVASGLPVGLPADAAAAARDTLGGAVAVAGGLPGPTAEALLATARASFVAGLQLTSGVAAVVAALIAVVAAVALRDRPATSGSPEPDPVPARDGCIVEA
ncbi:major facilitator superfamily MFS_1 [Pseudonocardia dioxanivorans CB1190]|uniref:Major facilitator superfamily MFS_1 n=1 Tax=Pseudonocardia dioxanivorans (strain ATCC 55486 / DSM 44775 / JCM 13855 / CB1190) TaxID=675635 RepID=F4D032_PSEUX|nr:MFS transporter [Pseudonocardia dioxanivorans]AEA24865.1 major facilitator superfamily MFS_1 [Pseudonocardia dioxanivorans CB1190]